MNLRKQRDDLAYVVHTYGHPQDLCGAVCGRALLVDLLTDRTLLGKAHTLLMQSLVDFGTVRGPLPVKTDKKLRRILKRWALEDRVQLPASWVADLNVE